MDWNETLGKTMAEIMEKKLQDFSIEEGSYSDDLDFIEYDLTGLENCEDIEYIDIGKMLK